MNKNTRVKIIAFYLPQYHIIPENDKWWGKGFTDWTNLQNAKPLFYGHNQPRVPQNNNYYNLMDINVLVKQAEQARYNGIYGFCYYHYWFNGHKLLEKPLEAMLNNKDVNIPFCLSWANDPWTRAWDGGIKDILMPQKYGDEDDWIEHIEYLIPFFQDSRYLRIENMPVLLIYRTKEYARFDEMIILWNKILASIGINELYIVETLNAFQKQSYCKKSKAILEFEPMITYASDYSYYERIKNIFNRKFFNDGQVKPKRVCYDYIWRKIIKRKSNQYLKRKHKKTLFKSGFVGWDNTPRKKENGVVFIGGTPEKFEKYMEQLIRKAKKEKNELLFVNAWNEWAEGCYLEPDETNGENYLRSLKNAIDLYS